MKRIDDLDRQLLMLAVLRLAITPDPLLSKRCFNVMKLLEGVDTTLFVESVKLGQMVRVGGERLATDADG